MRWQWLTRLGFAPAHPTLLPPCAAWRCGSDPTQSPSSSRCNELQHAASDLQWHCSDRNRRLQCEERGGIMNIGFRTFAGPPKKQQMHAIKQHPQATRHAKHKTPITMQNATFASSYDVLGHSSPHPMKCGPTKSSKLRLSTYPAPPWHGSTPLFS